MVTEMFSGSSWSKSGHHDGYVFFFLPNGLEFCIIRQQSGSHREVSKELPNLINELYICNVGEESLYHLACCDGNRIQQTVPLPSQFELIVVFSFASGKTRKLQT